jgi:hypothetical protein
MGASPYRAGRVCNSGRSRRSLLVFRLRTLVLLWLGRKAWAIARPKLQRRFGR